MQAEGDRGASGLGIRLLTAAVGLPIVAGLVYVGGIAFTLLLVFAAAVGTFELVEMARRWGAQPFRAMAVVIAPLYVVASATTVLGDARAVVAVGVLLPLAVLLVRSEDLHRAVADWAWTVAAPLYVGWPLGYFVSLRGVDDEIGLSSAGLLWVAATIAVVFATDSAAYLVGRAIGRRPLAPRISPAKTVEGTVGGIAASMLVGAAASAFLPHAVWQMALWGLGIGVAAVIGDLAESLLKRGTGVKDSGRIVPGHGGLLDRLDSLLFAGVAAYYLRALLMLRI